MDAENGRDCRMLDLDEFADAIEAGHLSLAEGIGGRWTAAMAGVSRSMRSHGSHAVGHMVGISTECYASNDEPVAGRLERGDSSRR